MDGRFETWVRAHRGFAAWPTNDDLTLVIAGWPYREFEANRNDVERHFIETLELAPAFAERIRAAKREERFVGAAVPGYSASLTARYGCSSETRATTRTS